MQKRKTKQLGLMPTLLVLLAVFGLAILVGVILLMMFVRTGIAHSPEQSRLGNSNSGAMAMLRPAGPGGLRPPRDRWL